MTIKSSDYSCDDGILYSKSMLIESPSDVEDLSFFFIDRAITLSKIRPILVGSSPSVTWTLRRDTDRNAIGTEIIIGGTTSTEVTTGIDITTFDAAFIPANSHVWLETTAKSGTIDSINLTIFY